MESLEYKKEDGIAYITFKEKKSNNAFSLRMLTELNSLLDETEKDDEINIIVFRGEDKKFGAGVDLREIYRASESLEKAMEYSKSLSSFFKRLAYTNKITIAMVEGYAIGAHMEMLIFTDINIASEEAFFSSGGPRIGLFPAELSALYLLFLDRSALKYILFADRITALEAKELGLIDFIAKDLEAMLKDVIEKIKKLNINALKRIKEMKIELLKNFDEIFDKAYLAFAKAMIDKEVRSNIEEFFKHKNQSKHTERFKY